MDEYTVDCRYLLLGSSANSESRYAPPLSLTHTYSFSIYVHMFICFHRYLIDYVYLPLDK